MKVCFSTFNQPYAHTGLNQTILYIRYVKRRWGLFTQVFMFQVWYIRNNWSNGNWIMECGPFQAKVDIFVNIQDCLIFGVLIDAESYVWTTKLKPALCVWNLCCIFNGIASKCVSFTIAKYHWKISILKIWIGSPIKL